MWLLPAEPSSIRLLGAEQLASPASWQAWLVTSSLPEPMMYACRLAVEYREEVVRAGFYPTHHGVPHSPSPQLLPALAWLQQVRLESSAQATRPVGPNLEQAWRRGD